MTASNEVVVHNEVGVHARPAALFVKTASAFASTILVENITKGTKPVNAKSMLRVLSVGIEKNDRLRITAEGEDEQAAVKALCELVAANFKQGV